MFIRRSLSLLLSLALLLCLFSACAEEGRWGEYSDPAEAAVLREKMKYIVHAAGTLTGVDHDGVTRPFDGSNSLEGLTQCAEAGAEIIELDFNFTADGALVCLHDWYREYADGITDNVPLTLAEFRNLRIYGNFTPVWLGDLIAFLNAHPGVCIVTDIKDDNLAGLAAIAEACPEMKNRFLVQIYDGDEYDAVRALGFEYVIYTLYRLDWNSKTDWRALGRFAETHPLLGFTFSYELCAVDGYVEGMSSAGVPLFIHTVNGEAEQQRYFAMGIDGIYTDEVKGAPLSESNP